MPNPENSPVQICPFWRRVAVTHGPGGEPYLVALCGRRSLTEKPLPGLTDFGERLKNCPYYTGANLAYSRPSIIVVTPEGYIAIESSNLAGEKGIEELVNIWDGVLEKLRIGNHKYRC